MDVFSEADGPRFPLINRRVSPTESGAYIVRTDSIPIKELAGAPTIAYCRLKERPVTAYGGIGMLVKDSDTGVNITGTATWPPSPGTFYVSPFLGRLYFDISAAGSRVIASYTGIGSIVDAVDINYLNSIAQQASKVGELVIVPANGSIIVHNKIAVATYIPDGERWILNHSAVTVEVYDILNTDSARSLFINNTAEELRIYVRFSAHFPQDK